MNFLDQLNGAAGSGIGFGLTVGLTYIAAAVGTKFWLDRDLLRPAFSADREMRREAQAQRRALKQGHVPAGQHGAGQFTSVYKPDGDVDLKG